MLGEYERRDFYNPSEGFRDAYGSSEASNSQAYSDENMTAEEPFSISLDENDF